MDLDRYIKELRIAHRQVDEIIKALESMVGSRAGEAASGSATGGPKQKVPRNAQKKPMTSTKKPAKKAGKRAEK